MATTTRMLMAVLCFVSVVVGTRAVVCQDMSKRCVSERGKMSGKTGNVDLCKIQERFVNCIKAALHDCMTKGIKVSKSRMNIVTQTEAIFNDACKGKLPILVSCKEHYRCDSMNDELEDVEKRNYKMACNMREDILHCNGRALQDCFDKKDAGGLEVVRAKYRTSAKDIKFKCNKIVRLVDAANGEVRTLPQTTPVMVVWSALAVIASRLTVVVR